MSRQNKQKKKMQIAVQVTAAHKAGNKMHRTLKLHTKRKQVKPVFKPVFKSGS